MTGIKHGLSIVSSAIAAAPDTEYKQKSHKETFPTQVLNCRTIKYPHPSPYTGESFTQLGCSCLASSH